MYFRDIKYWYRVNVREHPYEFLKERNACWFNYHGMTVVVVNLTDEDKCMMALKGTAVPKPLFQDLALYNIWDGFDDIHPLDKEATVWLARFLPYS